MAQKRQSIKQDFVDAHGDEMWDLVMSYLHKDNRSPEATEAWKLYYRIQQGLVKELYSVYGIYEGRKLLYIGKTSNNPQTRWADHKCKARNLSSKSTMLQHHMNEVGIENFQLKVLETFKTELEAELREVYLQDTLKPPFNKNRGGGGKSKLKSIRPISKPNDLETR